MRRWLSALPAAALIASGAYADTPRKSLLPSAPLATTPGSTDVMEVVQGGYSKRTPASSVLQSIDVRRFGADPTGAATSVAALKAAFEYGGRIFVPDGNYLIPNAGADAGGVDAIITKSLHVICAPAARFFTDATGVDNDMIRISVPSNGAGLPTDKKITVRWDGCLFDQQEQKRSTSVPFDVAYPAARLVSGVVTTTAAKQGTSATTDGLSIRGEYTTSGPVYHNGFASVVVRGARFYAGEHWQVAGGDGGLFVNGYDNADVYENECVGSRDQCIYASGSGDGAVSGRTDIYNNRAKNAFGAYAVKRSINGFSIHDNESDGVVLGEFVSHIIGSGGKAGSIYGNNHKNVQVAVRADQAEAVAIHHNFVTDFGAYLWDGTTAVSAYTPTAILAAGCTRCAIDSNYGIGVTATYAALNPWFLTLAFDVETGTVPTQYTRVSNNISNDYRSIGGETAGEADFNQAIGNYEFSGVAKHFQADGANTFVKRFDYSTGAEIYESRLLSLDGSVSAPQVARFGDPLVGIGWGTNSIFATRPIKRSRTALTPTGSSQSDAAAITGVGQVIRLSAFSAGQGVKLPVCDTSTSGSSGGVDTSVEYTIINPDADDVLVWPSVGDRIVPGAVDASYTQLAGTVKTYICGVTGSYYQ